MVISNCDIVSEDREYLEWVPDNTTLLFKAPFIVVLSSEEMLIN